MKQLLTVFCISTLLTLAACSTEKKEEETMPSEPMNTQMADDGEAPGMENLEEPSDMTK